MTKIKEAIYEHIQLKDITNQQATTEHVQQSSSASGVVIHSLLTKGNTATQTQPIQCCKGPFLCFCFLHAPLMYRHESNDFFCLFYCSFMLYFDGFPSSCHSSVSLVSSHSLLRPPLTHDCETVGGLSLLFFIFYKGSHN